MLEMLARLPTGEVPADYVAIAIDLPDDAPIEAVEAGTLPGWDGRDQRTSRAFGDAWLQEARSLALLVPAMAVPQERNVLINPRHPAMAQVTAADPIEVIWDRRLFERRGG